VIVTVTPNPSLDLTYLLPPAPDGPVEVLRAEQVTLEASGKGVNVTRTLLLSGVPSRCVLPLGGGVGDLAGSLLARAGVPARVVAQRGETRINTSLLTPDAASTKVNGAGAALTAGEQDDLVDAVRAELAAAGPDGAERWLAVCGSLPPDTDPGLVARLVGVARDLGWRSAVDSHGPALAAAVAAGADLVAPNVAELAALEPAVETATRAGDPDAVVAATVRFAATTGCQVLLSRGPDGAVWTDGASALLGAGEPVRPVNPAGAGDALLAGWLSGPADPAARLARAVAWGRACCLVPTTVADLAGVGPDQVRTWAHPAPAAQAVPR
jgi:1-phosphofructokinase